MEQGGTSEWWRRGAAWDPGGHAGAGIREALLTCGRKNAKSAIVAVLLLGFLADDGPLRRQGFRAGVASVSKEKATELWAQMEAIARASGIEGARFGRVPRVAVSRWGSVEFLSADKKSGHASGFDLALCDELGLYPEKGRDLVAGLLSSTSAKDGRLLAISVLGDSPLTAQLVKRRKDPSVVVHVYEAPRGCALDDETAWHAANPGIAVGIKSLSYMRDVSRRAAALPSEQTNFRAFDLNQPGSVGVDAVVPLDRWNVCANKDKPERRGACYLGYDIGGSVSRCAAAAYWPETSRLDTWAGYGDTPSLADRGEADAVGDRYVRMSARGELRTWPGRVTPVAEFLAWIAEELNGESVMLAAADRYKQREAQDAMDAEQTGLMTELRELEPRMQAAIAAEESDANTRGEQRTGDGETAEYRGLCERVRLSAYVHEAQKQVALDGAEAELRSAVFGTNARPGLVPWEALLLPERRTEERQDVITNVAGNAGAVQQSILGRVFAYTATAYLGAELQSVERGVSAHPVISAGAAGAMVAKGATHHAEEATVAITSLEPRRLTARYVLSVEDLARIGMLEEALRRDLAGAIGEAMDSRVVNGDGAAPNPTGILAGLAEPAVPAALATYADYIGSGVQAVDGRYSRNLAEVRVLAGTDVYAHAGALIAAGSDVSAADYLLRRSGGFRASTHMPLAPDAGTRANIGELLMWRTMGPGSAVAAVWSGFEMIIRDEYTGAADGKVAITAVVLWNFALAGSFPRPAILLPGAL